ncbi:MAG: 16S rRNA (cytosine(1402)-N(4))-methyltransferase [Planctomycetota bacterium]
MIRRPLLERHRSSLLRAAGGGAEGLSGGAPGRDRDIERSKREHVSVLLDSICEVYVQLFSGAAPGSWIVDATVGAGGHARALLEALPQVRLLGLDQDPDALDLARRELSSFGDRAQLRHARISQLCRLLRDERMEQPVAILADLGVSSMQIDRADRGFSFQQDGPLDMRMDPSRDRTAADIIPALTIPMSMPAWIA